MFHDVSIYARMESIIRKYFSEKTVHFFRDMHAAHEAACSARNIQELDEKREIFEEEYVSQE